MNAIVKHPPTSEHNYLAKILAFQYAAGKVVHVDVVHDDWCDSLSGRGFCNCDPEINPRPKAAAAQEREGVSS